MIEGFCQGSRQTCRRELQNEFRLRGTEACERSGGTTEVKRATAVGADMLVVAGARAEEVAQLVVGAAKALGGGEALEARILHSVDLVDHFI